MAATVLDWSAAVSAGRKLAPTGPRVTPGEAAAVVADLRSAAARGELIVRDTTGLGRDLPVADAVVVDRPGWIAMAAEGMELLTAPLVERMTEKVASRRRGGRVQMPEAARKVAGAQFGAVLAYLSGRVLGQFDPMIDTELGQGRLLLVAPNIIKVAQEIGADPAEFRMWVCLHESTHRLQFNAVPWLEGYFTDLVARFGAEADIDLGAMVGRAAAALSGRKGERRGGSGSGSWIEAVQSPAQREIFDSMMALMTLLEGHADHVMDAVGPAVIPSVAVIRKGFSERRKQGRGPLDRLVRALLGMDMKLAQYEQGAAFVSAVVDRVGMERFNTIWTSPETLPTRAETTDPQAWVARVLA